MGIRTAVKQVLIAQQDKKYEKELAQLKVTYEQWAAEQDRESAEPREIAGLVEFIIFRQAANFVPLLMAPTTSPYPQILADSL